MLQTKKLAIGLALSAVLTAVLLMVMTFLVLRMGILPVAVCGFIASVIGGIAVFIGAVFTARMTGEKGLVHGTVVGTVYAAVFALLCYTFVGEIDSIALVLRATVFILAGALGGMIGVGKKNKVKF